ncbi:GNAT family N-acetyltransferase [Omnitrophica bacterium]|nr:GNAT family N-acetyltransferase [Candidatus Omnitrophota bacterium]
MKIRLAEKKDRDKWKAYLDKSSYNPPLNHYAWKEILEESYKVKTCFFIALDQTDKICGLLPAYITKDIRGKRCLYSLRFGLVADDNDLKNKFLSHIRRFCEEKNIASNLATSGYHRIGTGFREIIKKTVVMDLPRDEEAAWRCLRGKTRNMIRKAFKSDLVTERGFHNLRKFYDIYTATMLDKGIPIHSYRFFKNISEKMRDNAELIVAKRSGEVAAASLVFFSKDIAIYPFQVSLAHLRIFAPNDLLIWETIRLCLEKRIFKLDMGESKEGGNVYIFKSNFGGTPRDIYYYTTSAGLGPQQQRRRSASSRPSFAGKILSGSPYILRKKMALWMKKRERLI